MFGDPMIFTLKHLVVKGGKAYIDEKAAKDGTYYMVVKSEPTQNDKEELPDFNPEHQVGF